MTHKTRIVVAGVVMVAFSALSAELLNTDAVNLAPTPVVPTFPRQPRRTGPEIVYITNTVVFTNYVVLLTDDRTNLVNDIATSGEFCRVRGHIWQPVFNTYAVYQPNAGPSRKCAVCGLQQSKEVSDWKK